MSLLADLQDAKQPKIVCKFCRWIVTRPGEEQVEWAAAVKDRSFSVKLLVEQAAKRGYGGAAKGVYDHRMRNHQP